MGSRDLQADFDFLVDSALWEDSLDLRHHGGADYQTFLIHPLFLLLHLGDQSKVSWEVICQNAGYSFAS